MICCDSPGHLRNSKNGLQFFYHKIKPASCSWRPESQEHEEMKYEIYKICKSEGWEVHTEECPTPNNSFRPDVYAIKDDRKIAFEVQFSKITLSDLRDREKKYINADFESYWLLKDFYGHIEMNYWDYLTADLQLPSEIFFKNDPDFFLNYEKYYFVMEKIRTIGIDDSNKNLYFSNKTSIRLEDWVKCCLSGDYQRYLKKIQERIQQKIGFFEQWKPILKIITEKNSKHHQLQVNTIYELEKNIVFISQSDMTHIRKLLFELQNQFSQIVQIKNQYYDSALKEKPISQNFEVANNSHYIEVIGKKIKEYSKNELKFSQLLHEILKDAQQKSSQSNIQFLYQRKQRQIDSKTIVQKTTFQFADNIPLENNWLIASSGQKYQNPWACQWTIPECDAIEFEEKGYGKIIEIHAFAPND